MVRLRAARQEVLKFSNGMAMQDFINARWAGILAFNGLGDFDALWQLEAGWFEEPNKRRGGWSGVSRYVVNLPEGGTTAIFIKRQENHRARLWSHPIKGAPTFLREFEHIQYYRKHGVPTLEPVYFAMREVDGDARAILITEELTNYVSVEDCVHRWLRENSAPARQRRREIMLAVARVLRLMHDNGIQHGCFLPKHVFIRENPDASVDVKVIDLEKSRWRPFRYYCAKRDLYSFNYESLCWNLTDRVWFLRAYMGIPRLTPYAKWLWRRIKRITEQKERIAPAPKMLSDALSDARR